jgi:hypothetical protein
MVHHSFAVLVQRAAVRIIGMRGEAFGLEALGWSF